MPVREKDVLDSEGIRFPDTRCLMLNVAQTRPSTCLGYAPCIVPAGSYWLAHLARRPAGREYFQFMGMWLDQSVSARYPESFQQDLSGNAFHAVSAVEACAIKFAVLAELWRLCTSGSTHAASSACLSTLLGISIDTRATASATRDSAGAAHGSDDEDCSDVLTFINGLSG